MHRAGNALHLSQRRAQVIGHMLIVDQQPVITNTTEQFGCIRIGQTDPQPDLRFAVAQGLLERIM
ncbi:hypothetical protein D3C86_2010320 [compost metagenome]